MDVEKLISHADAVADGDRSGLSIDLQSVVASYVRQRESGSPRAQAAFARVVVRRATDEGHEVDVKDTRSMDELRAEVKVRNEGRADADLIRPAGRTKADLIAALAADDPQE